MELQVAVCVAVCVVVCCSVLQCALHVLAQVFLRGVPTAELQDGAAGCSVCFSVVVCCSVLQSVLHMLAQGSTLLCSAPAAELQVALQLQCVL